MNPATRFFDPRSSILDPRFLLASCIPLIISLIGTAALLRWAPLLGLVDIPSERKIHSRAIPTGGGLAIFAAWGITVGLPWFQFEGVWVIGAAALIIMVLGLADDRRPLPWQFRLGVQTATTVATLWLLGVFNSTHHSSLITHYWVWPLAVLWVVGLVNAFNMLDNMDALSGGIAWIGAALFLISLLWAGLDEAPPKNWEVVTSAPGAEIPLTTHHSPLTIHSSLRPILPFLAFLGAVTGFLWFNRPPARIFMGDAGSTFLGFFLGIAGFQTGFIEGDRPQPWIIPMCILAIPYYDLTSVVFLRWRQGRSPFHADKQHLSHRLVNLGLSPPAAVGVIYLLALAVGGGGLLIYHGTEQGCMFAMLYLLCCFVGLALFEYWTRGMRD
jgi:UDP-GlcNAc:undecaprenyl-phosphate GlcNAc-1-phosphate transferase